MTMYCYWKCDSCGATEDGTEFPEEWESDGDDDFCAACAPDEDDDQPEG